MRHIIVGMALSAVLICGSALAETASVRVEGTVQMSSGGYQILATTVQYGDLDLSTNSGAAALLQRIEAASQRICSGKSGQVIDARAERQIAACQKEAVEFAVSRVKAPMLAQLASTR
jgi:UrcA family protein